MDIGQLDNPFKSKKKHDAKASPNPYQIGDYEDQQPSTYIPAEEKRSTKIVNKVKDEIHKAKTKAHSHHHRHNEQKKEEDE